MFSLNTILILVMASASHKTLQTLVKEQSTVFSVFYLLTG